MGSAGGGVKDGGLTSGGVMLEFFKNGAERVEFWKLFH